MFIFSTIYNIRGQDLWNVFALPKQYIWHYAMLRLKKDERLKKESDSAEKRPHAFC